MKYSVAVVLLSMAVLATCAPQHGFGRQRRPGHRPGHGGQFGGGQGGFGGGQGQYPQQQGFSGSGKLLVLLVIISLMMSWQRMSINFEKPVLDL